MAAFVRATSALTVKGGNAVSETEDACGQKLGETHQFSRTHRLSPLTDQRVKSGEYGYFCVPSAQLSHSTEHVVSKDRRRFLTGRSSATIMYDGGQPREHLIPIRLRYCNLDELIRSEWFGTVNPVGDCRLPQLPNVACTFG